MFSILNIFLFVKNIYHNRNSIKSNKCIKQGKDRGYINMNMKVAKMQTFNDISCG